MQIGEMIETYFMCQEMSAKEACEDTLSHGFTDYIKKSNSNI